MKKSALFFIFLIVAAAVAAYFFLWGTQAPDVMLIPNGGPVSGTKALSLKVDAPRALLSKLTVLGRQGEKTVTILEKTYPPSTRQATETFTLGQAGLNDGPLTLHVSADGAPLRFGMSKTGQKQYSFQLENKPPVVSVLSTAHNIAHGGSGLVVYTVSKEVEKTGVVFGNAFFPGYKQTADAYACLFPFPWNMDPNQYIPKVIAVDKAGNERLVTINYHLLPKKFPTDKINLTDNFLDKIASEFKSKYPQGTPLEVFLKANGELRQQDAAQMREIGKTTSPTPLWQGAFLRMPNAAPLGAYAQTRSYMYRGQKVDQQTHLGIDLASTVHAPVPAANGGKVVFASDLGLYGQCVVIDHGLGLQSLYGHLSQISVKVGETVEKGKIVGNTGATGMAGGDHLHYGMFVSGEPVNPIEWWDASWIKNNVTGKLESARRSTSK